MPTEKDTFNAELDAILGELAFDTGEEGSSEAFAALSAELDGTEFGFGCQRQSKSEPNGSAKCCHFGVGEIAA